MTPPTTILLPTTTHSPVIEEIATQLDPSDELLIICDDESDPVADYGEGVQNVQVVVAGEPTGCSGKANALATGMDKATHDRIVWTDDDFHHPSDWLAAFHEAYDEKGPVSELYFFVGSDVLSTLLEPIYAIGGTLGTYANNKPWGGAVMFERDDLDWESFLRNLQRTVSDDQLLSEYLDTTTLKRIRQVEIGGTIRETLERHVRFTQIIHQHNPRDTIVMGLITSLLALFCLLSPVYAGVCVTLLAAGLYAYFGIYRWTALLSYPAIILQVPLMIYALSRNTFVWGGRRYRWRSKFKVEIIT
ncbi:Glycosyltransferase, catalytic subunit of cellulose synthase and poly-beta-1,6-N-acetylglucosamine synthase [Halorubrum xinjiangense]|uniref:Glycosyltransferase, catalytic subunit of cellulose synthase and poly-beta-1,6-N-acetylglucosamine synthase n=1 Tax=Halorubrum xinjiangense TaxID=261291 RepID=A0A1G7NUC7_9EURY|nr:glycosyltransferase family 2 protein [Halorubrum xinjiangense]SDF77581.1 Glycosyltransferase, catalytic subunit of cellulose synthase and poly-beta-1,6-N-acetylglucosamine synthase [Halorubrum xinjiangense]